MWSKKAFVLVSGSSDHQIYFKNMVVKLQDYTNSTQPVVVCYLYSPASRRNSLYCRERGLPVLSRTWGCSVLFNSSCTCCYCLFWLSFFRKKECLFQDLKLNPIDGPKRCCLFNTNSHYGMISSVELTSDTVRAMLKRSSRQSTNTYIVTNTDEVRRVIKGEERYRIISQGDVHCSMTNTRIYIRVFWWGSFRKISWYN